MTKSLEILCKTAQLKLSSPFLILIRMSKGTKNHSLWVASRLFKILNQSSKLYLNLICRSFPLKSQAQNRSISKTPTHRNRSTWIRTLIPGSTWFRISISSKKARTWEGWLQTSNLSWSRGYMRSTTSRISPIIQVDRSNPTLNLKAAQVTKRSNNIT